MAYAYQEVRVDKRKLYMDFISREVFEHTKQYQFKDELCFLIYI